MRRRIRRLLITGLPLALSLGGCTTTYTEGEIAAEERKVDAQARREEKNDAEEDQQGGANAEEQRDEERSVDRESDL
jgi:hypothetical protein